MRFEVIPNGRRVPNKGQNISYLWTDAWNDWFEYQTLYWLTYFDEVGEKHEIGAVKIGQFGMTRKQSRPDLPDTFEALDERFFSLGQDADYYSSLISLGAEASNTLIIALNDIAADDELYRRSLEEKVTGRSLLRSVNMKTIEEQYRRILSGGAILTDYRFRYLGSSPIFEGFEPLSLEFEVIPESCPPTNIHVLVGRNGVGKTFTLNAMTRALVLSNVDREADGVFTSISEDKETLESPFANVLSVSFSAFDNFEILRQRRNASRGVRYTHIGLRKRIRKGVTITRDPDDLEEEFSESAKLCVQEIKSELWRRTLTTLEADPLFAEAEVAGLAETDEDDFEQEAKTLYGRLSSGHKIVLLTITKLVENVEEKTLVLMDEPEAHLHPPLLAAFVRALSDLLINRNGVAIIATHSPVVLQEVPRSCVWKIVRHGRATKAMRLNIETFAENIGVLTREVFGLEVMRSGFHKMIKDSVGEAEEIVEVVEKFNYEIGSEGRALISSMIASRKNDEDA